MPVLRNISQLATCRPDGPQADAGLIDDAAIAWAGDTIRWSGPERDLPREFAAESVIDGERRLVIPGLIDCHTHLCFGGWRGDEFEQRLQGASYQEIAAAGGDSQHGHSHARSQRRRIAGQGSRRSRRHARIGRHLCRVQKRIRAGRGQ